MDEYLEGIINRPPPAPLADPEPFVVIQLDGPPMGKGRPKFSGGDPFVRVYTPAKTVKYENALKAAGIEAMAGKEPIDGPISVVVYAYMPIPESWSKTKKAAALCGDIMPTTKPDFDNISKMLDGLNSYPKRFKGDREKRPLVWRDDAIIVAYQFLKQYSDRPRLHITVWRWE